MNIESCTLVDGTRFTWGIVALPTEVSVIETRAQMYMSMNGYWRYRANGEPYAW